ncbi:HlyD family efflux transporter periplasmic adaptor subunit [Propionivibrio soli]|uniref:HlyD family secretion protein n=1 Tax=Propionivibrio soli TaxID=2976531 RepID=UPI0021E6EC24|nr:HlyD family efflux transporter periplasmic adaptor subunit [Propionivibrio soli]
MSDKHPAETKPTASRRKQWLVGLGMGLALATAGSGAYYYLVGRWFESTEDAYANGNVVQISAQIPGTVVAIHADNNGLVKTGQVLAELDTSDARVALEQAEANLARTVRQVRGLYANVGSVRAEVESRRAMFERAQADYERRKGLAATGAIPAEELSHAREALAAAESALAASDQQLVSSHAMVDNTALLTHPDVKATAAALRRAYLDYSRSRLLAPISGHVAQRSVQVGQRVQAGVPLMAVVPLDQIWVDANFKETQLGHMRIGQPVTLHSDLYGSDITYHGKVDGLGVGTGSAFSLLPAQNATGNWIKIVQRVPVRIALDPKELAEHPLKIGLSMHAEVDMHDQSGPTLAQTSSATALFSTDVYAGELNEAEQRIARVIEENAGAGSVSKAKLATAQNGKHG